MAYVFLLDCDGMTIDSEYLAMKILADHIVKNRPNAVHADIMNMFGLGGKDILSSYGLHTPEIDARLHRETVRVLSAQSAPTAGMIDFLKRTDELIKEGVVRQKAIVTSSAIDRVVGGMVISGIMDYFHKTPIFSAESSIYPPKNKPDPAIYNHAKNILQVTDQDLTVAFEDSRSGVEAAKAAGINMIIGCMHGLHMAADGTPQRAAHTQKLRDAGADHIVDRLEDIWPILRISPPTPSLAQARDLGEPCHSL